MRPRVETLSEVAFSCYVYERAYDAAKTYRLFVNSTKPSPDLTITEHRNELIKWLNHWGMMYKEKNHEMLSDEIKAWFTSYESYLPKEGVGLWQLGEDDINQVGKAYEELIYKKAYYQTRRNGREILKHIGPTGASKILFALRPNSLIPWDDPIRQSFGYNNSSSSYIDYLNYSIESFGELCSKHDFELKDLPQKIELPESTLPMIIDEYYWMKITRGCTVDNPEIFHKWAKWS